MAIYFFLVIGWKIWHNTKYVKPFEADMWTGKAEVDRHEAEFLEALAAKTEESNTYLHWLYRHTLGLIFKLHIASQGGNCSN